MTAPRPRRRLVRREIVFSHKYMTMRLDTERDAAGREHTYIVGSGPAIASTVPLWPDGTVTLVSQRRHGLRRRSIEIPGGHVDPGETPLQAARRELREETGIVARRLTPILAFQPLVKVQQDFHVFLAEGLRPGTATPDADEEIVLLRLPFDEAVRRALSGAMVHGPSIVALLAVHERLRRDT